MIWKKIRKFFPFLMERSKVMMRRSHRLGIATVLALIFVLIFSGLALAGSTTSLLGFTIDFLGVSKSGNESTWTYAVTATENAGAGLSHWQLEWCLNGYVITSPPNGSSYTTPTDIDGCGDSYTCQAATYTVVYLEDKNGLYGIKFESTGQQLSQDNQVTHMFQFTVSRVDIHYQGDIDVRVKAGGGGGASGELGQITGPSCSGVPTAVTLSSLSASGGASKPWGVVTLLAVVALTGGAAGLARRRRVVK